MVVRTATPNKTMRITWIDGKTSLDVSFNDRGKSKSQIVVQHGKLASSSQAARMKAYWKSALERLSATV